MLFVRWRPLEARVIITATSLLGMVGIGNAGLSSDVGVHCETTSQHQVIQTY